jgi:hypothetical protein
MPYNATEAYFGGQHAKYNIKYGFKANTACFFCKYICKKKLNIIFNTAFF